MTLEGFGLTGSPVPGAVIDSGISQGPFGGTPTEGDGFVTAPGDAGPALGGGDGGVSEENFNAVEEVFAIFPWLRELGDEIYQVIVNGVTEALPSSVIVQNIRGTNAYRERFAGLIQRQAEGLAPISEAEYLELETGYMNQLRNFNILGTMGLDSTEAFRTWAADLIGNDVSVSELNARLDRGVALMRDSSDFIQQAFQDFYGVTVSDDALLAYFLEPDRGLDIIQDQLAAAQIGGEAFRYGLNISRTRAEILRREGVTADLAKQGFSDIAREQPVLSRLAQIHNLTPLSQTELEEFFFHEDPDVAQRRFRTFSTALAEFQQGGARGVTQSGALRQFVDVNRSI